MTDKTTKVSEAEARILCVRECGGTCIGVSALATSEETDAAIHKACWNWTLFLNRGKAVKQETTEREERLEEALRRIAQWADAYPTEIFPEVDAEYHSRARKALEAEGMTLDRLSASAMRHVVQGVGKIAKEALTVRERTTI